MGAGQHRGVVSVSIERVLHDVVTRDMHNVKEQAAQKFGQIETAPDLRAVEHENPQHDKQHTETKPEKTTQEAREKTDANTQEGEVGGEVERVEVAPRV